MATGKVSGPGTSLNGIPSAADERQKNVLGAATKRTEIKLISVRLKEAALDSPSFRASYNFYSSQVEQIEMWIEGLLKSMKKYPSHYSDFKEVNSVLLNQLIPDFLKGTAIDQDNTLSILESTKTDIGSLWAGGLKDLAINEAEITELLTEFSKAHIKTYKEIRKSFEFLQSKYDSTLAKYAGLSKTKEPSALREDSFQLYEVRKSYVGASLDICVETAKFLEVLDSMLMQLTEIVYKGRSTYDDRYFAKVRAWSQALTTSIELLLNDMMSSRNTIEKSTISQNEPSRDLKDHNPALINVSTLTQKEDGVQDSYEKHGWLYMKTTVGKPARTIWVRRWVFVKSGIFGMFVLSPSKTFVQETDKIGVLLANIRYAADEDRRFCFEVKTIDSTIMLQAETLKEMREWLRVFSEEKQRAIENSHSEAGKYAFGRYPPLLYEFACTSLTSTDVELTTSRAENANHDDTYTTVASSHLSNLVGRRESHDISTNNRSSEFRDPDLNTPISTGRSKLALISHAFLNPTVVPTAVTANIWGSVNWGMYYMSDMNERKPKNNLISLAQKTQYPRSYPASLKNYDLQLKSLFDSSTEQDELVVVHFACLWTLNSTQELSGRAFVTTKNAYFYMNSTGFVSLLKKPISELVAVDVTADKQWEWLKVYDVHGLSMKGRIFLSDGKLIQKKIDFLINNMAKDRPLSQEELIPIIESMESQEGKSQERHRSRRMNKDASGSPSNELSSFQPFSGFTVGEHRMRTNFREDFDLLDVAEFDAPPKAVFHIMFGDHSSLSRDTILLAYADEFNISPWYPAGDRLKRSIDYKMSLSKGFLNLRGHAGLVPSRCIQTIEEMVDNKYYRVEEERSAITLMISGEQFTVSCKYVIIGTDAASCKVLFYGRVKFVESQGNFLLRRVFGKSTRQFQMREIKAQIKKVKMCVNKLGPHGQVIKAIRTYGNLSQSDEQYKEKEKLIFHLTLAMCFKYYFKLFLFFFSTTLLNTVNLGGHLLTKLVMSLSMNKSLVLMLSFSLILNTFLAGRSTFSYWKVRRHEHVMKSLRHELELTKMERSISLKDLEVLTQFKYNTSSQCFNNFMTSYTSDKTGLSVDAKLRESRHEIAVKRNELIVELKILEQVEKELVAGNYRNFVMSELNLCRISLEDMGIRNEDLEEYCSSCIDEYNKMAPGLL